MTVSTAGRSHRRTSGGKAEMAQAFPFAKPHLTEYQGEAETSGVIGCLFSQHDAI
jgi:hypothetical protein